jgi:hypothetical protein
MFSKGTARRNVSAAAMIREKEGFSTMARMRFTDSLCSHLHTELRNLINVQDIIVHNPGMKALCFVRPSGEIRKTLLEVCKAIHLYSPGYRVVLPSDISEAASYAHAYGGGKSRKRTTRRRSSSSSSSSRSLKRKLK